MTPGARRLGLGAGGAAVPEAVPTPHLRVTSGRRFRGSRPLDHVLLEETRDPGSEPLL